MNRQELIDFRTDVTSKISEICRFIGLGLIAIFYAIETSSANDDYGLFRMVSLYFVGIAGVIAILLDYVQYVNNYRVVEAALDSESLLYDQNSRPYKVALFCFRWKQRVTIAGAVALILLVTLTSLSASTLVSAPSA